ncbi:MAG: Fe2+-dependent dioxygenase [Gammaproteobacteria bacterium]
MLKCMQGVIPPEELDSIMELIAACTFADGKRTAGHRARQVKNNLQLDWSSKHRRALNDRINAALDNHAEFQAFTLARYIAEPLISCYEPGMAYGEHVDDALLGKPDPVRSDLAVTVFLSDPETYDGGELYIGTSYGEIAVKLPRGDAVAYAANMIHKVAPVTRGRRLAAVTWVQSYVRDPAQREIFGDLRRVKRKLNELCPELEETRLADKTYSNLLRMWAEA